MTVHKLDPLEDRRWPAFLETAPGASVFYSRGWLRTLRKAYQYRPVAYTTSEPDQALSEVVAFCRVDSWLTGKRLVSLPFSDHCAPQASDPAALALILAAAREDCRRNGLKYIELRCNSALPEPAIEAGRLGRSSEFAFHSIDLSLTEEELYAQLHKTSIRQMIGRAEREELKVDRGRDEKQVDDFYKLLLATRRKHQVPPQPRYWFRILADQLGEAITFHVARHQDKPVAAIVTLRHREVVVHKYGCSDPSETRRGGTQLLLWEAIKGARSDGALEFDMGRSDLDNAGLIRFKERWGGRRSELIYYRHPEPIAADDQEGWKARLAKRVFASLPDGMLRLAGRILYKHVG